MKDILNYLRSLRGNFSGKDYELLVALTARKIYERNYATGELKIGLIIEDRFQSLFAKPDAISLGDIGMIIGKYGKEKSLTDIVLGNEKTSNPIQLQIKIYGIGAQKNGGTEKLAELLNKHKIDSATNEVLIIQMEDMRGFIDVEELLKKVDMETFPYKEVITIHHSKPDMMTHYVRLKPLNKENKFSYSSFTQDQVINL